MDYKLIVEKIKDESKLFHDICDYFQIDNKTVSFGSDTGHSINDIRINFYVNNDWVIKINSKNKLTQNDFAELSKVIRNYNNSGIYAPGYLQAPDGKYIYDFSFEEMKYVAWIEEYVPYEIINFTDYSDEIKIDVLEKTAKYMAINTNKDLMSRWSMWSIINLPDWEDDIDEKEQNYRLLRERLLSINQSNLISRLDELNQCCRRRINEALPKLRKCSIQGDLNATNILVDENEFIGLIDFNMSGTEVNINNILNETRYDLSMADFENLSAEEIFEKMTDYRNDLLRHVFKFYALDNTEKSAWDDYRKIVDLFLWPNVSLWNYLIRENIYVNKVLELISLIIES